MSLARSFEDPGLRATIVRRWPLVYAEGADPALDRPDHARSGSALLRLGRQLVIIQDDASFLALYDLDSGRCSALTLPAGPGGRRQFDKSRGNKMDKLDLEAAVPLGEDGLLAFGSGSAPGRDRILRVTGLNSAAARVELLDGGALYRVLQAEPGFTGSEMNLEGALWDKDRLILFNRGNGAPRDGLLPVNAVCALDRAAVARWLEDADAPVPTMLEHQPWDLGTVNGTRLTFTDAARGASGMLYLAAAEDSPDAVDDGPVVGVAIGVIAGGAGRYALLRERDGGLVTDKAEGLWVEGPDYKQGWIVFDLDDPERPAEMAEIRLEGDWG